MSRRAPLPPALRRNVFLGSEALRDGLLSPRQLRSSRFRPVLHDVYADSALTFDHGLRIAATRLVMPDGVTIAGRSAAWLHGVRQVGPGDPVEVIAPATLRRHPRGGVRVHNGPLAADDVEWAGPFRVTTPAQSCLDVARWHGEDIAIALVDAMLAGRLVTAATLDHQVARAAVRGTVRAGRLLALGDGRAASPPESRLRLKVIRAGLPLPEPQLEVWHHGAFVARLDLGWRQERVGLEYDGAWHGSPGQLAADRKRLNALVAAGWTIFFVTSADMRDLTAILTQVRKTLRAAA